jgi:hypothetical protein
MNENFLFNENDTLDEELNEYVSRRTLVSSMKETANKRTDLDDMSLEAEIRKNGWLYFFLLVSSLFTATLGFMMGIAPERTEAGIFYHTDVGHIVLSVIYAIAFVTVTEFAFGLAKWLYFRREEKNSRQKFSMITMMGISGISIVATGIAGGMVIASTIAFLTDFREIPHQAQLWVIVAIPTLMFIYALCGTVYILSSEEAAAKRLVSEKERENDLDHKTRQKLIKQWGREQVQREEIKVYIHMIQEGKLTAGEANAAIEAGMTLGQLEEQLGRDINEDGRIGSRVHQRPRHPAYASEARDFTRPPDRS